MRYILVLLLLLALSLPAQAQPQYHRILVLGDSLTDGCCATSITRTFRHLLADELGVFITICSRNDSKMVESTLEELNDNIFPIKNQIDYIIANNNDKSENIRIIAEQLSILPKSIVFIDDNQIVRDEVKRQLPEVFIPEWSNHNELVTQLIAGCVFERVELSLNSQNRRQQYRIIMPVSSCSELLLKHSVNVTLNAINIVYIPGRNLFAENLSLESIAK